MKKFLAVLLCGCLMMGVAAGCGTEQAETETEKETADVRKIDGYYPFSTIHYMEGVDDVEEAPASLYSGTHEDMEGTPYKFIGEVTGVKTIDEIDDETPMPCFFVRTENGDVLVTNGATEHKRRGKRLGSVLGESRAAAVHGTHRIHLAGSSRGRKELQYANRDDKRDGGEGRRRGL